MASMLSRLQEDQLDCQKHIGWGDTVHNANNANLTDNVNDDDERDDEKMTTSIENFVAKTGSNEQFLTVKSQPGLSV